MKKYISKKNNTNKKNKQTLKKTIKKTKKNNVLHGGSSYFLNLIKKNVYLSKLGSGAQYIKNSAMAGLAKGAQYVAETRVGKSVKTKVVSAFTSKEAYDFYDTIAAYILKKPKEHTKLIMNKVIKKTNSKPLTLDNLYQFFNHLCNYCDLCNYANIFLIYTNHLCYGIIKIDYHLNVIVLTK